MSAAQERKLGQVAAALAAGDHLVAERLCGEILERAPRHPRALYLAALARRGQGDSAGARAFLRRVLESDPRHLEAMKRLGAAELEAANYVQAESWLRRALALGGGDASVLCWLGLSLSSQGRHPEAVEFFRQAVAAAPEDAGLRLNQGNELMRIGAADEAIASYERALKLQPDYPEVLNGLGVALQAVGKPEHAIARFHQAIDLRPDYAEAHYNLGDALLRLGKGEEAAICFRRALALEPDNADYHADLGNALFEQQLWEEAIAQYERALRLKPDDPETLNSLASALMERGRPDDAIPPLRQALALRPEYAEAHDNLGSVLARLDRVEESNASFRRAITLQPEEPNRYLRFGNAMMEAQRWDEAVPQYERALELNPEFTGAQYCLATARLFRMEFEQAWPGYERRFEVAEYRKKNFREDPASLALFERLPRWRGPGEPGVSEVAIWAEQGIGDQVVVSTLIPELMAAGVLFLYEVDRRLLGAYQRAFPGARFVAKQEPPQDVLQRADRVLGVGSLPGLFRRSRESFARQPQKLFAALPERVAHYRSRLAAQGPGLNVALSWRSTRKDWWVAKKSAPLATFTPLLTLPGMQFVDVQYGDTAAERHAVEAAVGMRLARFNEVDHFNDLEELLAILEACDLLITTSNATAHFAGALGKRTWLLHLAERPPFHYWAHDGSHRCLWYPSVEIVTARQFTDWQALAGYAARKLEHEMAEAGAGASVAGSTL